MFLKCGNIQHNGTAKPTEKQRNLEENTMNEQIKNYFENLRINSENDATKLRRGTLEAY